VHELSVTVGVVDGVTARLAERGLARCRVSAVRLEVGALSGVVTDAVRFCFDAVAAGTPLAGARLVVDEPPGRGRCRSCGADVTMPDLLTQCPGCGGVEIDVVDGQQLLVTGVELAEPAPADRSDECAEPAAATRRRASTAS
jgi:hydrogenase nickel incorporation protein HypA/HybF